MTSLLSALRSRAGTIQTYISPALPLFIAIAAAAFPAAAEPLFSNGSANPTQPALAAISISTSGVAAPQGSLWSETAGTLSQANLFTGFSCYLDPLEAALGGGSFRMADDFTVTSTHGWVINTVTIFAYQPGYTGTTSPFSGATLRVWDTAPNAPQSQILYGDATSNRLVTSTRTSTYRIANSRPLPNALTPGTSKRLWAVTIDLGGFTFPEGTYWIDVQLACASPDGQAFAIPATQTGSRGQAGANAMIFAPGGMIGAWQPLSDPGKPYIADDVSQGLAFVLDGAVNETACPADYNLDGGIDGADVASFFDDWSSAQPRADVNEDGGIDGSDVSVFFNAWSNGGC